MKYLPKGSDRILNSAIHFIQENIIDNVFISKQQIKNFINDGNIVFLIDNVKTNDTNHTLWITKFIGDYGKNRFILTLEEEFFHSLDIKEIPDYGGKFKQVYIQYMGKTQIRAMVTQWAKGKNVEIDEIVNRIDSYCNQINFAKTPFNIALFMVIWDDDNNFIPINEGIVMENYLEIVLEKLSIEESYRSTYSFKIKQNFLSYIAHEMYLKDEYFFSVEEFNRMINNYHERKGYKLSESRFDKVFFEKNILTYYDDFVVFSHTSFLEYFLALEALNDTAFLEEITSKNKRINFKKEICFYAGLNQNCMVLLDKLSEDILDIVINYIDLVDSLNDIEIMAEFKIDKEEFIENIQKNRPSQEELDLVNDASQRYNEKKPVELSKKNIAEEDAEDFLSLLQMYGSIIKNAELLDNKDKILHLENYICGMNMLYAILIKFNEYLLGNIAFEELDEKEKKQLKIKSEKEFVEIKNNIIDFVKLIYPIAIQNMILENVGTPKLESAVNILIKKKESKPFEKFMLTFLKCDLKKVKLKSALASYIKNEKSDVILKLILIKLTYYYTMRFFGSNNSKIDKELINLITEIQIKLQPRKGQHFFKSQIENKVKKNLDKIKIF